jgi:hypothetical protein
MVEKQFLDDLIWTILRGFENGYKICSLIQEATEFPKKIPKSFWNDEDKGYYGILGYKDITKDEMRTMRKEVIEAIINEIASPENPEAMYSDNYTRLFHALTIFKIPKSDERVPGIGKYYMYNIAYLIWAADDGSEIFAPLMEASWSAAEAFKTGSPTNENLITGRRHSAF